MRPPLFSLVTLAVAVASAQAAPPPRQHTSGQEKPERQRPDALHDARPAPSSPHLVEDPFGPGGGTQNGGYSASQPAIGGDAITHPGVNVASPDSGPASGFNRIDSSSLNEIVTSDCDGEQSSDCHNMNSEAYAFRPQEPYDGHTRTSLRRGAGVSYARPDRDLPKSDKVRLNHDHADVIGNTGSVIVAPREVYQSDGGGDEAPDAYRPRGAKVLYARQNGVIGSSNGNNFKVSVPNPREVFNARRDDPLENITGQNSEGVLDDDSDLDNTSDENSGQDGADGESKRGSETDGTGPQGGHAHAGYPGSSEGGHVYNNRDDGLD